VSGNQFDPTVGTQLVTYTVTVNGCTNSASTTITVNTAFTWYADQDGDGLGDPSTTISACDQPAGYVSTGNDPCPILANMAPGDACDDGNAATSGDMIQSDCICAGVPDCTPGAPCDDLNACTTGEVFQSDCGCSGGTAVPDSDNDGLCDAIDPCPALANLAPGDTCDDGDPCTINDQITADCDCTGTPVPDSDGDGLCDLIDPCPELADLVPGDSCNDGDPCTVDDQITTSCDCAGTPVPDTDGDGLCDTVDPCPVLADLVPGDACDDGNEATSGDMIQSNCICEGVLDCTPGTPCDDQNACTTGEVYQNDCSCGGGSAVDPNDGDPCTLDSCDPVTGVSNIFQDADADGVCDANDECPGTAAGAGVNVAGCSCAQVVVDDGDPCTLDQCTNGDVTHPLQDADADGVCDANDDCPGTLAGAGVNVVGCSCAQVDVDDSDPCTLDQCTDGNVSHTLIDLSMVEVQGPNPAPLNETISYWAIPDIPGATYSWTFTVGLPWLGWSLLDLDTTDAHAILQTGPNEFSASVCVEVTLDSCPPGYDCEDFSTGVVTMATVEEWFSVYPNPSDGGFRIIPSTTSSAPIQIHVYDALGQLVITPMTLSGSHPLQLDLKDRSDGLYFLRATRDGESRVFELLIAR